MPSPADTVDVDASAAPLAVDITTTSREVVQVIEGGQRGAAGPTGPAGPPGPTGDQGPAGGQGLTGPQGVQGPQGMQGPRGNQGMTGPTGIQGPQGLVGPGITMKGSVATSSALPATGNTQGDAYIVRSDDSLWLWDGGIWVSGGSIQGPQGLQGVPGNQGPAGTTGTQGVQGTQGPTGSQGPAGSQGPSGPAGATGPVGPWVQMTQAAYDALAVKDSGTLYVIIG